MTMMLLSSAKPKSHGTTPSIACSVCGATFASVGIAESATGTTARRTQPPATLTRIGLDGSFVNIPRSIPPPSLGGSGKPCEIDRNIHDIASILDHALRSSSNKEEGGGRLLNSTGANMHEASRRTDVFLESTVALLSRGSTATDDEHLHPSYYCRPCLGM